MAEDFLISIYMLPNNGNGLFHPYLATLDKERYYNMRYTHVQTVEVREHLPEGASNIRSEYSVAPVPNLTAQPELPAGVRFTHTHPIKLPKDDSETVQKTVESTDRDPTERRTLHRKSTLVRRPSLTLGNNCTPHIQSAPVEPPVVPACRSALYCHGALEGRLLTGGTTFSVSHSRLLGQGGIVIHHKDNFEQSASSTSVNPNLLVDALIKMFQGLNRMKYLPKDGQFSWSSGFGLQTTLDDLSKRWEDLLYDNLFGIDCRWRIDAVIGRDFNGKNQTFVGFLFHLPDANQTFFVQISAIDTLGTGVDTPRTSVEPELPAFSSHRLVLPSFISEPEERPRLPTPTAMMENCKPVTVSPDVLEVDPTFFDETREHERIRQDENRLCRQPSNTGSVDAEQEDDYHEYEDLSGAGVIRSKVGRCGSSPVDNGYYNNDSESVQRVRAATLMAGDRRGGLCKGQKSTVSLTRSVKTHGEDNLYEEIDDPPRWSRRSVVETKSIDTGYYNNAAAIRRMRTTLSTGDERRVSGRTRESAYNFVQPRSAPFPLPVPPPLPEPLDLSDIPAEEHQQKIKLYRSNVRDQYERKRRAYEKSLRDYPDRLRVSCPQLSEEEMELLMQKWTDVFHTARLDKLVIRPESGASQTESDVCSNRSDSGSGQVGRSVTLDLSVKM